VASTNHRDRQPSRLHARGLTGNARIVSPARAAQDCGQPQSRGRRDCGHPRCFARLSDATLSPEAAGRVAEGGGDRLRDRTSHQVTDQEGGIETKASKNQPHRLRARPQDRK
jgi:hypothetical protein